MTDIYASKLVPAWFFAFRFIVNNPDPEPRIDPLEGWSVGEICYTRTQDNCLRAIRELLGSHGLAELDPYLVTYSISPTEGSTEYRTFNEWLFRDPRGLADPAPRLREEHPNREIRIRRGGLRGAVRLTELEKQAKQLEARAKDMSTEAIDKETDELAKKIEELAARPELEPVLGVGSAEVKPLGVEVKPAVDHVMDDANLGGNDLATHWVAAARKQKPELLPGELAKGAIKASEGSKAIEDLKSKVTDAEQGARAEREVRTQVVDEYFDRLEQGVDTLMEAQARAKTHKNDPGVAATKRVKDSIDAGRARAKAELAPEWRYTNAAELEDRIARMNAQERIAMLKPIANERAKSFGWDPAKDHHPALAAKNQDRTLFADGRGNVYSLDTQHGRFEVHDRTGKHLREINMDGAQTKPREESGDHDLRPTGGK